MGITSYDQPTSIERRSNSPRDPEFAPEYEKKDPKSPQNKPNIKSLNLSGINVSQNYPFS